MHIAWCGPVSLSPLQPWLANDNVIPEGYVYPLGAYFVEQLLRCGHRVTVVTTRQSDERTPVHHAGDRLKIVVVCRRRFRSVASDFFRREVRDLTSALLQAKPDIVHAQWTYEFADAAIRSRLPSLVTARDSAPAICAHARNGYRFFRLVYSYFVIPRIRHLAVPSPYLAAQYRRFYGKRKAFVVPNGLRDDFFLTDAVRDPEKRRVVTAITGWDNRKNPKTLLRAFAQARSSLPDLRLIMMGGGLGPDEPGERWARANNLHDGVEFRGHVSHNDAIELLRHKADLFVHTTLEESFCMSVVEAMAAGVPVIAGERSGAVPWVLGEGRYGRLVNVRSPDSVSAGILELASARGPGTSLAGSALQYARKSFSMSHIVESYLGIYEDVIRSGR